MPEGPEIRRAADRIERAIGGAVAREVYFKAPALKGYEATLAGRRVEAIEARGKALLTRFEGPLYVYSHNQLYGRWYIEAPGARPETGRELRFAVHTEAASALLYSASEIEVLTPERLPEHPFLRRLGPDPLNTRVTTADVVARLELARFRRRQLGALLLDQGFLAGLGNYLRAEILFLAGLHPRARPVELLPPQRAQLAETALSVVWQAYFTRGVTTPPHHVRARRRAGDGFEALRHFVFGRDGQPCWLCGATIERLEVGGRRIFVCPGCQPEAGEARWAAAVEAEAEADGA